MQVYKLTQSALFLLLTVLAFLVLFALATLILFAVKPAGGHQPPPLFLALVWGGVIAIFFFSHLRVPYAITWMDDDSLEFRGLLMRTRVLVKEIISIKAIPMKLGFIKIKYRGGSIRLLSQITGLYELIGRIRAANPEVEIKGC